VPHQEIVITEQISFRTAAGMFCRHRKITQYAKNGNVSTALPPKPTQLRILDVALDEDFSIRLLSTRAALYARPRPKMAREARARHSVHEVDRKQYQSMGAGSMTITEYAATTARVFMAAEIAMASVNCGASNVTRAQAEKLLGDYFALVEQAIPWTENNPLDRRSSEPRTTTRHQEF
jgi:hypothetical protein